MMKARLISNPARTLEVHARGFGGSDFDGARHGSRAFARSSFALSLAILGLTGCVGADLDALDLAPESHEAAEATLARIDAMLDADPEDSEAREALVALRPRLDELNHLVARIEVGPNHTVSFYEVEPGALGISESAPEGEARVLTDELALGLSVTELYEALAREPAPANLVDAEAREAAVDSDTEDAAGLSILESSSEADAGLSVLESSSEAGATRVALTSAQGEYFRDNLCFVIGSDFSGCYTNYTDNRFAAHSAKTSFFTVAPYQGNVSVRFQYSGDLVFTDPVFEGEVRSWWWHSSTYRINGGLPYSPRDYRTRMHHWEIINASGNGFHWAFNFRWDCFYHSCDAWLRR